MSLSVGQATNKAPFNRWRRPLPDIPERSSIEAPQPLPENSGTFSLEMAHFGAISVVYFNRNVTRVGYLLLGPRQLVYIAGGWRGPLTPLTGEGSGNGAVTPTEKICWDFSLKMAHFGANSIVYFNKNVKLFIARTTTITVYCWRLTGSWSYWGGFCGRGCDPSPENFGTFSLEMLILVQIQLYFNRNVRQFTATCIHVLLAAKGEGSFERVEPPRYGPATLVFMK